MTVPQQSFPFYLLFTVCSHICIAFLAGFLLLRSLFHFNFFFPVNPMILLKKKKGLVSFFQVAASFIFMLRLFRCKIVSVVKYFQRSHFSKKYFPSKLFFGV
jgi:hypothetical protein